MRTKRKSASSGKLSTEERKKLKSSDFGLPEDREFPMPDAVHVHAAEAYFRYAPAAKKPLLAHRILIKAKKFNVEVKSETIFDWAKKYKQ